MTSTASFKEKLSQAFSIFKWDLKACSSIMTVYSILAAVFTTVIFTLCAIIGSLKDMPDGSFEVAIKIYQYLASSVVYLLTIIFTIVYTVKVYSYLHNKRKADLYGSLPVSRTTLFFSKSASAFLFSIIPSLFFLGIISIISIVFGQPLINEALDVYIKLIIGTLASISAYGLISVCCGTTANSVIMFIATCIVYPISAMFIKGVAGGFFYGSYSGLFKDHFIMNALNPLAAYDGINVIYWIIFSVVCIVASAFLVKKRKAERAQASFAYYLPCHIIKVLIAFIAGMFLGVLFGSLNQYSLPFFIFGFILGSVPAFVISHLIFYKGFTNLFRTSIPLGGLVVVVIGVMTFLNFDVINYNHFVPNSEDVKSAGFILAENSYFQPGTGFVFQAFDAADDFEDKENIDHIITMHNDFLSDKEITPQTKFQSVWVDMFMNNLSLNISSPQYCFAYKMNDGRTITRVYSPSIYSNSYDSDLDATVTSPITFQKEYVESYSAICNAETDRLTTLAVRTNGFGSATIYDTNEDTNNTISIEDSRKVLEAFRKDFEADKDISDVMTPMKYLDTSYSYGDNSTGYGISDFEDECPDAVCIINIGASNPVNTENNMYSSLFLVSIFGTTDVSEEYVIPASYTNTIEALREIGVLDSENELDSDSSYYNSYNYDFY